MISRRMWSQSDEALAVYLLVSETQEINLGANLCPLFTILRRKGKQRWFRFLANWRTSSSAAHASAVSVYGGRWKISEWNQRRCVRKCAIIAANYSINAAFSDWL